LEVFARAKAKTLLPSMENAAATNPIVDAIDMAVNATVAQTAPTTSTATTMAIAKLKAKVKKELTVAEREVQNRKRRRRTPKPMRIVMFRKTWRWMPRPWAPPP
jgi:ribulose kinase